MEDQSRLEATAARAVAGTLAGLLLSSESSRAAYDEFRAPLLEIKDQIVARLETLADFTRAKYERVVKAVLTEYAAAVKISVYLAQELEARLQAGYEEIHETLQHIFGLGFVDSEALVPVPLPRASEDQ